MLLTPGNYDEHSCKMSYAHKKQYLLLLVLKIYYIIIEEKGDEMIMKISCERMDLEAAISVVQKAIPQKTTHPILEGILVKADDDGIELISNNLEMSIEYKMKANIEERGDVVINSKLFWEIIRRMPGSEVYIEEKDENVAMVCNKSKFNIKGNKAESFPMVPGLKKDNSLKVSQSVIKDMIRQTIFCVGEDKNRPVLTGVNIEVKDGILTFVAIDGFRLALKKYAINDESKNISIIVPGKTLNEIGRILEPVEDEVAVYIEENQAMFDIGNIKIVSRLLEGEYINYESVIPEEYEAKIRVNKKDFLDSIERASILAINENTRYPIIIKLEIDKMVISTNTPIGSSTDEIAAPTEGNEMEIKFNPRYFIEALRAIEEEYVDVLFSSDIGPCVIKSVDKDTFLYIVLPLRK